MTTSAGMHQLDIRTKLVQDNLPLVSGDFRQLKQWLAAKQIPSCRIGRITNECKIGNQQGNKIIIQYGKKLKPWSDTQ